MTTQEKHILLNRYKRDALFRQWLPTLGVLSRTGQGGEVEIWYEAERALLRLRQETHWREVEVQLIYTDLCERYPALPVFCLAVMAVLFTCLADAAPSADRAEENPHAPICVAICAMLDNDQRFHALLDAFFSRTCDNRGERVVLPVRDYLAGTGDEEVPEPIEEVSAADGNKALKQMVENALKRDNAERLNALKLRLYDLENPALTRPLIVRINERITALVNPLPVTQNNIFHNGANQINQSTLQNPVFGTGEAKRTLTEKQP